MDNILVCDDDKAIVEAIEIYLTQEGYHILKAYDGQEALDILTREPVDLLIMDIMMPHLDGIRATVKIRFRSSSCLQNPRTQIKFSDLISVPMITSPNLLILWN